MQISTDNRFLRALQNIIGTGQLQSSTIPFARIDFRSTHIVICVAFLRNSWAAEAIARCQPRQVKD